MFNTFFLKNKNKNNGDRVKIKNVHYMKVNCVEGKEKIAIMMTHFSFNNTSRVFSPTHVDFDNIFDEIPKKMNKSTWTVCGYDEGDLQRNFEIQNSVDSFVKKINNLFVKFGVKDIAKTNIITENNNSCLGGFEAGGETCIESRKRNYQIKTIKNPLTDANILTEIYDNIIYPANYGKLINNPKTSLLNIGWFICDEVFNKSNAFRLCENIKKNKLPGNELYIVIYQKGIKNEEYFCVTSFKPIASNPENLINLSEEQLFSLVKDRISQRSLGASAIKDMKKNYDVNFEFN